MGFVYQDERFADLQLLRYRLNGFDELSLRQKILVYYLSKATLFGRDITFDQYGKYNLRIRKMLEVVYCDATIPHDTPDFHALETYLKRVWFSNGIYHHYGCEKFRPDFSSDYLRDVLRLVDARKLPLNDGESVEEMCRELFPVIFDKDILPARAAGCQTVWLRGEGWTEEDHDENVPNHTIHAINELLARYIEDTRGK